uniref:Ig-like domain-containing protein n=1 Tax=Pavo cristatus TaxID=9049 RepID=A0A8C9EPZ8_PAVCR
ALGSPLLPTALLHPVSLTQPASVSANQGETVKITCSGGSSIAGNYYYGWYQQKSPGSTPGSAPVTVIYYDDERPSNIPSQFSGSKSGSMGMLTITGVQAEDEAVYYCGNEDSSGTGDTEQWRRIHRPDISGSSWQPLLCHYSGDTSPMHGPALCCRWLCQVPCSAPL